jgi:hypothetical protein
MIVSEQVWLGVLEILPPWVEWQLPWTLTLSVDTAGHTGRIRDQVPIGGCKVLGTEQVPVVQ